MIADHRKVVFEDSSLARIASTTNDPTIEYVANTLTIGRPNGLARTKKNWQFLNRLLLILASDRHVVVETTEAAFSIRNRLALLALLLFCLTTSWAIWSHGVGSHLLAILSVFSLISGALAFSTVRSQPGFGRRGQDFPFRDRTQLISVRNELQSFHELPFPENPTRWYSQIAGYILLPLRLAIPALWWIAMTPFLLYFQSQAKDCHKTIKVV
jgi:hypothetical protein